MRHATQRQPRRHHRRVVVLVVAGTNPLHGNELSQHARCPSHACTAHTNDAEPVRRLRRAPQITCALAHSPAISSPAIDIIIIICSLFTWACESFVMLRIAYAITLAHDLLFAFIIVLHYIANCKSLIRCTRAFTSVHALRPSHTRRRRARALWEYGGVHY